MSEFKVKLKQPRELSFEEWQVLSKMLSTDFMGKDSIVNQLKSAKVVSYCPCGCKTVDIEVDNNLPKYEYGKTVPVQLTTYSQDGVPIMAAIHIRNGYVTELEIFRADSEQINEEIKLDQAVIEID